VPKALYLLAISNILNMGIQGLLPYLKSIQVKRHISHYTNKKVAIDGFCWYHPLLGSIELLAAAPRSSREEKKPINIYHFALKRLGSSFSTTSHLSWFSMVEGCQ
jgi:XPG N-terminal domain